jgi:hypothetical protein
MHLKDTLHRVQPAIFGIPAKPRVQCNVPKSSLNFDPKNIAILVLLVKIIHSTLNPRLCGLREKAFPN